MGEHFISRRTSKRYSFLGNEAAFLTTTIKEVLHICGYSIRTFEFVLDKFPYEINKNNNIRK